MEIKKICKKAFYTNKVSYILLIFIIGYSYRNVRPLLNGSIDITIAELFLSYYNGGFWIGLLIPIYLYIQEKIMDIYDDTKILMRFSNFREWWNAKVKTIFYFDFIIVSFIALLFIFYMIMIKAVFSLEGLLIFTIAILQQLTTLFILGIILQLMMMAKYNFYLNFVVLTVLNVVCERLDYMFDIDMSKYYSVARLCTVKYLFDDYGNPVLGTNIFYLFGSIILAFILYKAGLKFLDKKDVLWR